MRFDEDLSKVEKTMEDQEYLELEGPEDEELEAEPKVEEPVETAEEPAEKTAEHEETEI